MATAPAGEYLDTSELDDEVSVEWAKETADQEAFQQLLMRYRDRTAARVFRLGMARGMSRADIEDAQSDALLAIVQALTRFKPGLSRSGRPRRFSTFVYRLVTNRFQDFAKHRQRELRRDGISLDSGHAADHKSHCTSHQCRQLAAAVVSNEPEAVEVAQQNEDAARLHDAIAKLKPMCRQVAELDLADGSIDEIAAELKINVECAKKRRTKARAELRRLMTEGECDAMTSQK